MDFISGDKTGSTPINLLKGNTASFTQKILGFIFFNKFNDIIYKGDLVSLRRFKKDVNEVSTGLEFGVCLRDLNDVKVGDRIEIFDLITCNNKL
nr:hypothetical protein [Candidatus Portiera aleyrodidarum]